MYNLSPSITSLRNGQDLSTEEASDAALALASAGVLAEDKKAFLKALHEKGETISEITAFARVFRGLALDPGLDDWAAKGMDIVGTGGTGSGGYNISSVSSFIAAAGGVPVLKHGNRAITSKSGAADFLAHIGIPLEGEPQKLRAALEELNFCFFFAPAFHPAFREIMPVRKELAAEGQKTIFNVLGPLINPARPQRQLLGVAVKDLVRPLADVLSGLGLESGIAVHCELPHGGRMDEFTTAGVNHVAGIGRMRELNAIWQPEELDFATAEVNELVGEDAAFNFGLLQDMLKGRGRRGLVDSICWNAGAALWIAERSDTLAEACELARDLLLGGKLKEWLEHARDFYASEGK